MRETTRTRTRNGNLDLVIQPVSNTVTETIIRLQEEKGRIVFNSNGNHLFSNTYLNSISDT